MSRGWSPRKVKQGLAQIAAGVAIAGTSAFLGVKSVDHALDQQPLTRIYSAPRTETDEDSSLSGISEADAYAVLFTILAVAGLGLTTVGGATIRDAHGYRNSGYNGGRNNVIVSTDKYDPQRGYMRKR